MAEQQRTTLATRPLIEALADKSRAAFTINSSPAPARSQALLRIWEPAFTNNNPRKKFAPWAFRYMFEKNKPDFSIDDSWLPVRPLGAGSFGAVGLFENHDDEGQVDDHVVAKYAQVHDEDSIRENIPGISAEAAIMMQLNEIPNSEGVLYLRNFRHYCDMQVWLHLLEYCPNLNLEALRLMYTAMKRTLPQSFLWYVFYGLAKGLAAMETGPFGEDLHPSKIRPGSYLLHRDMKPENTFMGYSASPSDPRLALFSDHTYIGSILSYPHGKIADFGLSTITSNHDPNNTATKQQKMGSAYWRPPEMRTIHMPPLISTNPFPTSCFDSAGIPPPGGTHPLHRPTRLYPHRQRFRNGIHDVLAANARKAGFHARLPEPDPRTTGRHPSQSAGHLINPPPHPLLQHVLHTLRTDPYHVLYFKASLEWALPPGP